jgi:hypothetical protein
VPRRPRKPPSDAALQDALRWQPSDAKFAKEKQRLLADLAELRTRELRPAEALEATARHLAPFLDDRGPRHDELIPVVHLLLASLGSRIPHETIAKVLDQMEAEAREEERSAKKLGWISTFGGPVEAAREIVARLAPIGPRSGRSLRRVGTDVNKGYVTCDELERARIEFGERDGELRSILSAAEGLKFYVEVKDGAIARWIPRALYVRAEAKKLHRWPRGTRPTWLEAEPLALRNGPDPSELLGAALRPVISRDGAAVFGKDGRLENHVVVIYGFSEAHLRNVLPRDARATVSNAPQLRVVLDPKDSLGALCAMKRIGKDNSLIIWIAESTSDAVAEERIRRDAMARGIPWSKLRSRTAVDALKELLATAQSRNSRDAHLRFAYPNGGWVVHEAHALLFRSAKAAERARKAIDANPSEIPPGFVAAMTPSSLRSGEQQ